MKECCLVLPHHLFEKHPCLEKGRVVVIWEHPTFFTKFKYHKKKLVLHRASMKFYADFLKDQGYEVRYVESGEKLPKVERVFMCDPSDCELFASLKKKMEVEVVKGPDFFWTENFDPEEGPYKMAGYYIKQRKTLGVLVSKNGKPKGGKWSFDKENRKKLPKKKKTPELWKPAKNEFVKEAAEYVEKNFGKNWGEVEGFFYPVSFEDARKWLREFLKKRFDEFGPYEDAMEEDEAFLFHSLLSAPLNCGLLTPQEVLDEALEYAKKHDVPMASLEGFVRQIIGWREFIHEIYLADGDFQKKSNHWKARKKISKKMWEGKTGIAPYDAALKRIHDHAYCHHIERLMVFGNLMTLLGVNPDEAYEWFMTLFIDAYEWVMIPNVYGMALHADGGLMTTKPYISGSNYIRKMSHYEKGEWCDWWDGLYWDFIQSHKKFFNKNPRLSMMVKLWEKMDDEKKKERLAAAKKARKEIFG